MKLKIRILSFFALLGFMGQVFADSVPMQCNDYGTNTIECTSPLWVSNGLGANLYMELVSVSGNYLDLSGLPQELGPPPPRHANTDYNGLAQINAYAIPSTTTVVYNVDYVDPNTHQKTPESVCTFYLTANSNYQLTGSGSCIGLGLAAPVNAEGDAALDIGIN